MNKLSHKRLKLCKLQTLKEFDLRQFDSRICHLKSILNWNNINRKAKRRVAMDIEVLFYSVMQDSKCGG